MSDKLEDNIDDDLNDDLTHFGAILSKDTSINISSEIDKQIIAAASRELSKPKKKTTYQYSWWRKLSLPLYVATGFTFSVFAYKSMWQVPEYQLQQDQAGATQIFIDSDTMNIETDGEKTEKLSRELPTLVVAPNLPERSEKIVADQVIESTDKVELLIIKGDEKELYTGIHLSKAEYPEKEAWARKIIDQMREGEMDSARTELIRFKKIYPNYPIEEQIKVFLH